jgi:predicted RNA polymerase sigma factor
VVLQVLYLILNEGHDQLRAGPAPADLTAEAIGSLRA